MKCACGCGRDIVPKRSHKWNGVPKYIPGHNMVVQCRDPEFRKHISKTSRERWADPEYRKRACDSMHKKWDDPEYRKIATVKIRKMRQSPEQRKKTSESMREVWKDPIRRKKLSIRAKKQWEDVEYRKIMRGALRKLWDSPEHREMMRIVARTKRHTPETRALMSYSQKKRYQDPEQRRKVRESLRKLWKNEEFRDKMVTAMMKGQQIRPNLPEVIIGHLLNASFPGEYEYTGDGSFIIGGFNPDFANCNGKKLLIEMQGDFWHNIPKNRAKDVRKIQSYAKLGYSCLFVWEHELENPEAVIEKIREFTEKDSNEH